jgi:pimeloyl-ACP methyl ester carboxylesterase
MGHSRGGYTIVRTAMDHPRLVRSLLVVSSATLMSAPNSVYEEWDRQAAAFADPREQWRHRLRCNSFSGEHLTEDFIDVNVAMEALPKHQEARRKMGDRRMDEHLLWHRFRSDLIEQQELMRPRIEKEGLPCPLLLLWGFDDPSAKLFPTGMDAMRLLLPAAPSAEFHVFRGAGHYVYREQPVRFAAVVDQFLEGR